MMTEKKQKGGGKSKGGLSWNQHLTGGVQFCARNKAGL